MRVYLSLHDGQLVLSDLPVHRSGDDLVSIGFPTFRFDLKEVIPVGEASLRGKISNYFSLKEGGSVKLELRPWPEG